MSGDTINYKSMWNGLYTYKDTKQDKKTNSINNLVRIEVDDTGKGTASIPQLNLRGKKFKDITFNINTIRDKHILGHNDKNKLKIGGILLYTGSNNRVGLTLVVNLGNKADNISGNPRGKKLLNNVSIKISGLSKGQYPDIACVKRGDCPTPTPDPSPDNNCINTKYGCCPDGTPRKNSKDTCGIKPKPPKGSCLRSKYGCCPDGKTPRKSANDKCGIKPTPPKSDCANSKYGCCPDGKTPRKNSKDTCGTKPPKGSCLKSKFGCCPDGKTARISANDKCGGDGPNIPGVVPVVPVNPYGPNTPIIPGIDPLKPLKPSGGGGNKPHHKPSNKPHHHVIPDKPSKPPHQLTPQEIMDLIEGNTIPGDYYNKNHCPPGYPYASGTENWGEGNVCCIGKPIMKNGIYSCDAPGACHGLGCKGNSIIPVECETTKCYNNKTVASGSMCPIDYPYPFSYAIGSNTNGEMWGGDGFFCCADDPGVNGDCPSNKRAACPYPKCRINKAGVNVIQKAKSVICSQKIISLNHLKIFTDFNTKGISYNITNMTKEEAKQYQYITFSTQPLYKKSKDGKNMSISTKLYVKSKTITNNFVVLKTKSGDIINIDRKFNNYIPQKNSFPLSITLTINDLTTCKSNDKPLYPLIGDALKLRGQKEWHDEWASMGSKSIPSKDFMINNLNNGPDGLTKDILDGNPPYDLYSDSSTKPPTLYFYDKSNIPIDCSTYDNCKKTCSGYTITKKGDYTPYFSICNDDQNDMFCLADNNYATNIRNCGPDSKTHAIPKSECSGKHSYPYDNGEKCCAINKDINGFPLTNTSNSCYTNKSIDCDNAPCAPNGFTIINIPKENSNTTEKLAYDTKAAKNNPNNKILCSPDGSSKTYPSCSNMPVQNKKLTVADNIKRLDSISITNKENKNDIIKQAIDAVNSNALAELYTIDIKNNTIELYPMINKTQYRETPDNNSMYGFVYKNLYQPGTYNGSPYKKQTKKTAQSCSNFCQGNETCEISTYDSSTKICNLYNTFDKSKITPSSNSSTLISIPTNKQNNKNYYLNNPSNALSVSNTVITENTSKENFQTAIDNIKIEHFTTQQDVSDVSGMVPYKIATEIKKNCNDDPYDKTCKDDLNKIFPINEGLYDNRSNFNNSCPPTHPYAADGGENCISKRMYDRNNTLTTLTTNNLNPDNIIKCDKPPCKSEIPGSNNTVIPQSYIFNNNSSSPIESCHLDNTSIQNSKGMFDMSIIQQNKNINICGNPDDLCQGSNPVPDGKKGINTDLSILGGCVSKTVAMPTNYGHGYYTGTKNNTNILSGPTKKYSKNACADECNNKDKCLSWNYEYTNNSALGDCTLLNSVPVLLPQLTNTVSGISQKKILKNSSQTVNSQAVNPNIEKCKTKFKNNEVYAIDNSLLETNSINNLFNTSNKQNTYIPLQSENISTYFSGTKDDTKYMKKIQNSKLQSITINSKTNKKFYGQGPCGKGFLLNYPEENAIHGTEWACASRCKGNLQKVDSGCWCACDTTSYIKQRYGKVCKKECEGMGLTYDPNNINTDEDYSTCKCKCPLKYATSSTDAMNECNKTDSCTGIKKSTVCTPSSGEAWELTFGSVLKASSNTPDVGYKVVKPQWNSEKLGGDTNTTCAYR